MKIINICGILILVLLGGCSYLAPTDDEGVVPVTSTPQDIEAEQPIEKFFEEVEEQAVVEKTAKELQREKEAAEKKLKDAKKAYWEKRGINQYEVHELWVEYWLNDEDTEMKVYAMCYDKVICYYNGINGGMDCLRDSDLVNRYCNYKLGQTEEEE